MNFKILLATTLAAIALIGCGERDHIVGVDNIGPADSTPLDKSLVGVWQAECEPYKNGSHKFVLDYTTDGTTGKHDDIYAKKGCEGDMTVIDGPRYNYKIQPTTNSEGVVKMQSVIPEEKLKENDVSYVEAQAIVTKDGKSLAIHCRTIKVRSRRAAPADACFTGTEIYTRVDLE